MKMLLIAAAVLAVVSRGVCEPFPEDQEFEAWKVEFGKSYNTSAEAAERKQIWINHRRLVLEHNLKADQGLESYRLGMTFFADMENDEYRRMVSKPVLHRFNMTEDRNDTTFFNMNVAVTNLPATVDWVSQGYVTPVQDQKNCRSCWAFSATGSLEGQTFKKTGRLVPLSKQQLVDCSFGYGNQGCKGGLANQAFNYIIANRGIDTEASYQYTAVDGQCHYNPATIGATCKSYVRVRRGDEGALQQAVATIGPISMAIDSTQKSFQLYTGGVYDEPRCSSTQLDHDMLIVGYGTESGKDYWLVKNSWGTKWGNQGYIKMSRNKNNQCGVATDATYPVV